MFDNDIIKVKLSRRYINDILLLAVFLCAGFVLIFVFRFLPGTKDCIRVEIALNESDRTEDNLHFVRDYPLAVSGYIPVLTKDGDLLSFTDDSGNECFGISDMALATLMDAESFIKDCMYACTGIGDNVISADEGGVVFEPEDYDLNIIRVEDGCAYMYYSDCPDKLCIHMPPMKNGRLPIVCLPHGLGLFIPADDAAVDQPADTFTW